MSIDKRLKEVGKKRADANEAAWSAMSAKFPPLNSDSSTELPAIEDDARCEQLIASLAEKARDGKTDLIRDTLWTYEQIANNAATPAEAPSLGAWSLLKWARQNQDKFFPMVSKAFAQVREADDSSETVEDPGFEELEQMIADFNKDFGASIRKDLTAEDLQFVRNGCQSLLQDWQRDIGITLPNDACEGLTAGIVELVDQCRSVE